MNYQINSIMHWLAAHKLIITAASGLFLLLVLWLSGVNLTNRVSNWWYARTTQAAHEEIEKLKGDAAAAKIIAAEALKALVAEKEITAGLRAERERRDRILADKTLTTNEKLKLFEAAMVREPAISPPADTDALCERAKKLGISCD